MSQAEAGQYRGHPDYYNLTLGFNDLKKKPTPDQLFKIIKVKFLNGESQFSEEEIKFLKQWFKIQGASKMQKLYFEHILKGYPKKASRFHNSPLQKLFVRCSF
jgi:IS5 family transposase